MSYTVLTTDHGTWRELTLNRPDRLNAFNDEMHRALYAALEAARDGDARAILLTGAGRGFCAGQDLGDRDPAKMTGKPDLGHTVRTFYAPLVRLIRALELPVICAVNGVAAGAGASLALACDIVLAGNSARFIQSFARVGLVPDTGGSWHLPRTKACIQSAATATLEEHLETEARAMKICGESDDYAEGLRAFLEKRDPVYRGR